MPRSVEALIISFNEPQLERCLQAVREQTIPFSNITHINGISPEHNAFNSGISLVTNEWVMKIDGDMILYEDAVETVLRSSDENESDLYMYSFGLDDTFIKRPICGVGVFRARLYRSIRYPNMLSNDVYAGKKIQPMGWKRKKPFKEGVNIGTHCDSPDEFQVFRRFYTNGVKDGLFMLRFLTPLFEQTKDPLYDLAIKAVRFGAQKRYYPTSHNLSFDKKMFEEFYAYCRRNS